MLSLNSLRVDLEQDLRNIVKVIDIGDLIDQVFEQNLKSCAHKFLGFLIILMNRHAEQDQFKIASVDDFFINH